jgi:phosphopantothenate---cysteine ligase (CTP)
MNILVTAGNTLVPIDRVRGITNIFTGRTGAAIAVYAHERGHDVLLLTSKPDTVDMDPPSPLCSSSHWELQRFSTFDDLESLLSERISASEIDAVIHCAAVSDYRPAGIFAPASGTRFDRQQYLWENAAGRAPALVDRGAGKVKSDEPELWLRLVKTPKLIDRFRDDWNFCGLLVKFKLEVGVGEPQLVQMAEQSRVQSHADLMVANTLEGAHSWAYLGPLRGGYRRLNRQELPVHLLDALENMHKERTHG